MHPALQVVELVEIICAQVAEARPPHASESRSLARLARTCTIFLNPALNVLWRHQGTILNVLRCMPSDLWCITETKPFDDEPTIIDLKIVLLRPVTFAHWERFLFYSHRVKSFSVADQGSLETQEVYEILSSDFPESYIFPNLQKLNWRPTPTESFPHVRLFLSPRITYLRLAIESVSDLSILSTMALKFPGLTIVRLATFVSNMVAIPAISEFVCALRNLESLVVSGLNRAALLHIARLPGLRYLWLMSTEKPIPIFSFQPPAGSLHFPILTTLEIETMEHASILLKFMGKCSLVEIRVISRVEVFHTQR
ncbi:hypothetical protein B0H13DRAFT_2321119 [Mycena leptocephala]|nr:hypothetical protein B0H13DRAFT_2321119 [Mycena leptocephala]